MRTLQYNGTESTDIEGNKGYIHQNFKKEHQAF